MVKAKPSNLASGSAGRPELPSRYDLQNTKQFGDEVVEGDGGPGSGEKQKDQGIADYMRELDLHPSSKNLTSTPSLPARPKPQPTSSSSTTVREETHNTAEPGREEIYRSVDEAFTSGSTGEGGRLIARIGGKTLDLSGESGGISEEESGGYVPFRIVPRGIPAARPADSTSSQSDLPSSPTQPIPSLPTRTPQTATTTPSPIRRPYTPASSVPRTVIRTGFAGGGDCCASCGKQVYMMEGVSAL